MKHFIAVWIGCLIAVTGCKPDRVEVRCQGVDKEGIVCTVTKTDGSKRVKTCWDVTLGCENGTALAAKHLCESVDDKAPVKRTLRETDFPGIDKCDKFAKESLKVANIELE